MKRIASIAAIAAAAWVQGAAAATIRVPEDQPTIQAAVAAADNLDTILLNAGFWGDFSFSGKGLFINIQSTTNENDVGVGNVTVTDGGLVLENMNVGLTSVVTSTNSVLLLRNIEMTRGVTATGGSFFSVENSTVGDISCTGAEQAFVLDTTCSNIAISGAGTVQLSDAFVNTATNRDTGAFVSATRLDVFGGTFPRIAVAAGSSLFSNATVFGSAARNSACAPIPPLPGCAYTPPQTGLPGLTVTGGTSEIRGGFIRGGNGGSHPETVCSGCPFASIQLPGGCALRVEGGAVVGYLGTNFVPGEPTVAQEPHPGTICDGEGTVEPIPTGTSYLIVF